MVQSQLRLALSRIGLFVDYNHQTSQFPGYFELSSRILYSFLEDPKVNRSIIVTNEGFGSYNVSSGNYSGVFGMIQRNEADMAFYPNIDFQYVVGDGVIRGQLMECEPPAIVSAYNSMTKISRADLLIDTLKDIGTINLSLFSIGLFLLTHLLTHYFSCDRHIVGSNYDPIMSVITYLFQKIQIKVYNFRTHIICITLTTLLFYFLLIFSSMLHVNLVKVDPPIVINDYNDVIERLDEAILGGRRTFKVAWSIDFPDTGLFHYGSKGSKEKLIWDKNNAVNGGPLLNKLGTEMMGTNEWVKDQSMVIILNKGYSYFLRNALCDFNDAQNDFHAWISVDKDANWNQKGYVIRESMAGNLRNFVDDRTRRILEGGLMLKFYVELRALRIDVLPPAKRSNCSAETIQMSVNYHENEESKISNVQLKVLYCTCTLLIILAAIYILIEIKYLNSDDQELGVWIMQVKPVKLIRY